MKDLLHLLAIGRCGEHSLQLIIKSPLLPALGEIGPYTNVLLVSILEPKEGVGGELGRITGEMLGTCILGHY